MLQHLYTLCRVCKQFLSCVNVVCVSCVCRVCVVCVSGECRVCVVCVSCMCMSCVCRVCRDGADSREAARHLMAGNSRGERGALQRKAID